MNEFWTNIVRYPKFLISSTVGLILIILAPLRKLFKVERFRFGLIFLVILFLLFILLIIKSMLAI